MPSLMHPHRSLWLREIADVAAPPAPTLRGDSRADVAVIGGGYVGLWTALRIKERDPACDVAVLEADICGGGASGRNGGFVLSWWAKLATLMHLFGQEEALRLARASESAIGEMRDYCATNQIDAHFRQAGWLWTATCPAHIGAWEKPVRLCERLGIAAFERLAPEEVSRRAGSSLHRAGVLERCGATVHPAALARGLRRVALERGVRIYENTPVNRLDRARPAVLRTPQGRLVADRVVIATNAWAGRLRELRGALAVVSSDIVATAPIATELAAAGWTGGEGITDSQQMINYYRTTRDSRIVFGKGGWGISFAGSIGPDFDRNPARARDVLADFHRAYPQLAGVRIDADWSGPIDRTATGLPLLGRLGGHENILYGVGWSGNGVGPSLIGGKILASLALGSKDEWSASPLVDQNFRRFPPEPFFFLGAHLVRGAVRRKERAEAAGRSARRLDVALARLAPAGLEDH